MCPPSRTFFDADDPEFELEVGAIVRTKTLSGRGTKTRHAAFRSAIKDGDYPSFTRLQGDMYVSEWLPMLPMDTRLFQCRQSVAAGGAAMLSAVGKVMLRTGLGVEFF